MTLKINSLGQCLSLQMHFEEIWNSNERITDVWTLLTGCIHTTNVFFSQSWWNSSMITMFTITHVFTDYQATLHCFQHIQPADLSQAITYRHIASQPAIHSACQALPSTVGSIPMHTAVLQRVSSFFLLWSHTSCHVNGVKSGTIMENSSPCSTGTEQAVLLFMQLDLYI